MATLLLGWLLAAGAAGALEAGLLEWCGGKCGSNDDRLCCGGSAKSVPVSQHVFLGCGGQSMHEFC